MIDFQKLVKQFHIAMEQPAPSSPIPPEAVPLKLRAKIMIEEALEYAEACGLEVVVSNGLTGEELDVDVNYLRIRQIRKPNPVKMIDAIADELYVTFGAAVAMGIPIEPFFLAVHDANMAKRGGGTSPEGKKLKPAGWVGPESKIQSIYRWLGGVT